MSDPAPDSALCRAAAPRLHPLQLLLPDGIDPLQLHAPPLASTSAAAPRLHPLQLLLVAYVRFSCCSLITSPSTAPRLRALRLLLHPLVVPASCSSLCVLRGVRGSVNLSTKVVHHESSPSPRTSHFCHTHTHRHTHIIYCYGMYSKTSKEYRNNTGCGCVLSLTNHLRICTHFIVHRNGLPPSAGHYSQRSEVQQW